MRKFAFYVAVAVGLLHAASTQAADLDYDVLRGAADEVYVPPVEWGGVYIGGHGGYSNVNSLAGAFLEIYSLNTLGRQGFTTSDLRIRPETQQDHGTTYGAFAGYNVQLDDVVVGVEIDYTRGQLRGSASRDLNITGPNGASGVVSGDFRTTVTDYGTVRARAGYSMGSILPFATVGLAVARLAETNQRDVVINSGSIAGLSLPLTRRVEEKITYGVTLGAGVDFALTDNILLRGEFQHIQLDNSVSLIGTQSRTDTFVINTFRGGAAVKF